jgi:AcrR family transcriptional regulator
MGIKERREREKDERREEIISAAEAVFFKRGLAEATMDEIAEGAELSKGTLYLYYKSKEDLYLAVMLKGMEVMSDLFKAAVSTDEPSLKQIANLGEAYYQFFENNREYFRMFSFFESPLFHTQVSPEMLQLCTDHDRQVWDLVMAPIKKGLAEGMLHKGLDPMEVAVMLWSNSNGLMRLIDRQGEYWKESFGVDISILLRKSNAFLVEAMMTDEAKKLFSSTLLFHGNAPAKREAAVPSR